jgi:hypothetical protein
MLATAPPKNSVPVSHGGHTGPPPTRPPSNLESPPLAHRALQAEPSVGLLLPCNVVVAERGESGSRVSLMDPVAVLDLVDNPAVEPIAADAAERLRCVAAALES